ncbi:MAG TPA: cupin domain-containing protein [Stellaceae bacterium]|nr:cupin domain-containing protein [Stellaceae bacterium]
MKRAVFLSSLMALSLIAASELRAEEAAKPAAHPSELMRTPLTGDANREVRLINVDSPPGADTGWHRHHGDQYTTVQEGEVVISVKGQGEHTYKAGEVAHIDPGAVHRTENRSGKPARTLEVFIVEKDKPLVEKAE